MPEVRWVGHYHPAYKLQQGLLSRSGDRVEVNVVVFPELIEGTAAKALTGAVDRLGGSITYEEGVLSPVVRVRIAPSALPALAALPEVRWIDRYDPPYVLMNNVRTATGAAAVSAGGYSGAGVVGEVKDSDIDQSHPDFGNLVGTDGNPSGPVPFLGSHGSCTFGIVFGDGTGNADATGMMLQGDGIFCAYTVGRATSIANLRNNWDGVFQTNSWGEGAMDGTYSSYSQADDQAIIDHDVMIFYSAGNSNEGVGPTTITQDAAAKNVVCVGAVNHFDTASLADDQWQNGGTGSTPSQGPAADGRIKPDLCAFFDQVLCTDATGLFMGYNLTGDYFSGFGGTSASCPIVAGAAGLVYEMYRDNHFGNNPGGADPDTATVKGMLIANAHQYDLAVATRYQQGWGLVDVERIHEAGPDQLIVDGGNPLGTGQTWSTTVERYSAGEPLKIALVWDDRPGETSSSQALVNDLDLRVTAPGGSVYYGNSGLVGSLWSSAGGSFDRSNNVENVFIEWPEAGSYTIEVIGHHVALDNDPGAGVNQDFSLVASMAVSGGGPVETIHVVMDCVPGSGILPYTLQLGPQLYNDESSPRTVAARITVALAGGAIYPNWKSGTVNFAPGASCSTAFKQNLPDYPALHGDNTFTLIGEDVTPAPYNQPPYSPSGDTDTDGCVTTGS